MNGTITLRRRRVRGLEERFVSRILPWCPRRTLDWQRQDAAWKTRDLSTRDRGYVWADGIYVKAGLETSKAARRVLIGGLADETKVGPRWDSPSSVACASRPNPGR